MKRRGPGRVTTSAAVLVLLAVSAISQATFADQRGPLTPIQHVIIIMQENHSFDNYFGTYPTANGTLDDNITSKLSKVDGIPAGVCVPYPAGCVSPRLTTNGTPENPVEGQTTYENDYTSSGFAQNSGPQSMVYFDYHSIPAYWDYAEEYGLADNYFAAVMSTTTPNRLMLLTGDTLVSSNYGPPPYAGVNSTIFGQLERAGITWGYYDYIGSVTNTESTYPLNYISGLEGFRSNIRDLSTLFGELASSSGLPAVSFVNFLGESGLDEHPPFSPSVGEMQTVSVVNAVMESGFWNSTAIFVTYDEGGGFYDHVTPPLEYKIDHNFSSPLLGLGQRVPLLVISPFSRLNYVSHSQLSHLSLVRFVDYNWGLPPLSPLVAEAGLPLDFFDFSQPPRLPVILQAGPDGQIPYPVPLQTGANPRATGSLPPLLPTAAGVAAVLAVAAVVWLALRGLSVKGGGWRRSATLSRRP